MRLWDRDTGEQIRIFEGHTNDVSSVAFSPDGKNILSGSRDGNVKMWDIDAGKIIITMIGFKDGNWINYTTDNYYDSSDDGDKYVAFRIGNKIYGFEQYEHIYKNPKIISIILKKKDINGVDAEMVNKGDIPPPEVVIQFIEVGEDIKKPVDQLIEFSEITIVVKAVERKQGLEKIIIENNGKIVFEKNLLEKKDAQIKAPIILNAAGYNEDNVVSAQELQVFLEDRIPKDAKQTPQLRSLGIGEGQFVFYREGEF